jgi:hypothetical protein
MLVALALSACNAAPGEDERPEAPAARADSTRDAPAPIAASDSPVQPDTVAGAGWTVGSTSVQNAASGVALLRSVRAARHDEGFDRIVFDFGDDEVPAYHVEYVDRPVRQCGSGETVPLTGDAWLTVRMQPANAHTEEGEPTVRERALTPNLPTLLELELICDFEAQVEWVAAVSSPEQYRAFTLDAPNRLVLDIRHR